MFAPVPTPGLTSNLLTLVKVQRLLLNSAAQEPLGGGVGVKGARAEAPGLLGVFPKHCAPEGAEQGSSCPSLPPVHMQLPEFLQSCY